MFQKINIPLETQKLIVYLGLLVATFAVYWQVNTFDFVMFDDNLYIIQNSHIQSGITAESVRWAFSTKLSGLWNPLVWLSFMFDYQLFGLNAGGYHLNNLFLHILSTLLLFWLFNRMTGAIWRSAFVAAFFALHPLHVESVVWISERKDVLSAFFLMLTLCFYLYYTEKPSLKRYLPILFFFILALMSKPMVITLPLIMILLDYWPLKRLHFTKETKTVLLQQAKEKLPFFILSAVVMMTIFFSWSNPEMSQTTISVSEAVKIPLSDRFANAPVAFIAYLIKTFWPYSLSVFYPFPEQIPVWKIVVSSLLIVFASFGVIVYARRLPYFFVGLMCYSIMILPVIGIIQISSSAPYAMADRYHYLPSIGIAVMLAWGIPFLFKSWHFKKIVLSAGITFLAIMMIFSWRQCGVWKNSIDLFSHALRVTENNYLMHYNRGTIYLNLAGYQQAIEDFDKAVSFKPDYADAINNRGLSFLNLGRHQQAIEDFNLVIRLKPDYAKAFNNRGIVLFKVGRHQEAIADFERAIRLKPDYTEAIYNRDFVFFKKEK